MLITSQSPLKHLAGQAGGKAAGLHRLSQAGLPVAPWVCLPADVFRSFREQTGIDAALREVLREARPDNVEESARRAHAAICEAPWPADVQALVADAHALFGGAPLAIRSSALDEDTARHSFAGQLSSFLWVAGLDDTLRLIQACWASACSARSLHYRLQHGLSLDPARGLGVAVILQQMIDCEKSGVAFTCHPVTENPDHLLINAVHGVGEGLVSGQLDADTYVADKRHGTLLDQTIVDKDCRTVAAAPGVTQLQALPEALRRAPVLAPDEIAILARQCAAIERLFRQPQDIEWGWHEGRLLIFQSRPITGLRRNTTGRLQIWDNANIVESYQGITLPLTFTFARHVYHKVYVQFCEILLVPQRDVRRMESCLSHMLGIFQGRVYYNLLNWYRLVSTLPGLRHNSAFMETMMGVDQRMNDEIRRELAQGMRLGPWRRMLAGLKFLVFHFRIGPMVESFLRDFDADHAFYRGQDYATLPSDEIHALYQQMETTMLWHWKAPIVNDFLCMVHFGLLRKLTAAWLAPLGEAIHNDLLCGEGGLESAEPARALVALAALVRRHPALQALVERTPADQLHRRLAQVRSTAPQAADFADFLEAVEDYIDRYGHRCMGEMKLEQTDLHQDPAFLYVCLKNQLRAPAPDLAAAAERERLTRREAEARVRAHLPWARRRVFFWVLKHARQAVRHRENTRFCRTRVYGIVRTMFNAIGQRFSEDAMLRHPRDIFYLTLEELKGVFHGTLPASDLQGLVDVRQRQYAAYAEAAAEPAPRFVTRGPAYWRNPVTAPAPPSTASAPLAPGAALQGIGCCPGVVEGVVKVVTAPSDDLQLNGHILVARQTDPGWIALYPSASGLLVERGGLLSHSAIVAREMGLPTVVGVSGLMGALRTGMRVRLDGARGSVEILS